MPKQAKGLSHVNGNAMPLSLKEKDEMIHHAQAEIHRVEFKIIRLPDCTPIVQREPLSSHVALTIMQEPSVHRALPRTNAQNAGAG